jgi:hypothetical protein
MAVIFLLLALTTLTPSSAKGWRDIVPLHSTRADVERLLGPPSIDRSDITFYEFERESVSLHYAKGPCGVDSSGWNVPRDTVIIIRVRPKPNLLRFADLKLDERRYKKETNDHVQYMINYINEEEGISYEVDTRDDNIVTAIEYFPATKDAYLRCPASGDDLEMTTKFDSYSDIPFESEKQRLDCFSEQMRQYASTQAYIMVYAGRRARAGEAEARARRAKEYLVKGRGIEAGRITTIDGGHQEELRVELYLVPLGARPPLSAPTVEPSEVQIIKAGSARNSNRRSTRPR